MPVLRPLQPSNVCTEDFGFRSSLSGRGCCRMMALIVFAACERVDERNRVLAPSYDAEGCMVSQLRPLPASWLRGTSISFVRA